MRIRGVIDPIQDADVELGYRLRNRIEQLYEAVMKLEAANIQDWDCSPVLYTGDVEELRDSGGIDVNPLEDVADGKLWEGQADAVRLVVWKAGDFNWRFCLQDTDVEFCTQVVMLRDADENP